MAQKPRSGITMAARTFAQLNANVVRSRKFRGLDHRARWAWICALLRADYAGIVEYPIELWQIDAELDSKEISQAIEVLCAADLVNWCADQDLVRIVGFIKQRPPDNASAAKRLCTDLTDRLYAADSGLEPMLLATCAEFAVAAVARSMRWEEDSPDRPKLRETIGQFLRSIAQDFGTDFFEAIETELAGASRPTRTELEGLLPNLSIHRQRTIPTPSPHPVDTRDGDET